MVESETSPGGRNWSVESFRLTTFHNSVGTIAQDVASLWETVTGDRPDQVSSRPRENVTLVEGPYAGNRLVFTCRPDRTDWNLRSAPQPPDVPADEFITMGFLTALLPPFLELSKGWLGISPGITRFAFGSILLVPMEGLLEANGELDQLLPKVEVDSTGSSDFFYQINRPRQSLSKGGVVINRLSKWSVMQGGSLGFTVPGNVEPQIILGRSFFACRLELDVNTAGALQSPIVGDEAISLFEELVQLGKEITEKGDIP